MFSWIASTASAIAITPSARSKRAAAREFVRDLADTSIPATKLVRFPTLPTELRLRIWFYACKPRLVIWGHGGAYQRLPAVCQTNREARQETKGPYEFYKRPAGHIKGKKYLLLVDMEKDVLYRRCKLPKSKVDFDDNGKIILPPPCKATDWMRGIKHLAINLDDATSDATFWMNLGFICPRLKELLIVCGPNPKRGDDLDGFVETTVEEESRLGEYNERRMMMMEVVECGLVDEKSDGLSKNLELTFLKKRVFVPKPNVGR